jgi:hypothetical protein
MLSRLEQTLSKFATGKSPQRGQAPGVVSNPRAPTGVVPLRLHSLLFHPTGVTSSSPTLPHRGYVGLLAFPGPSTPTGLCHNPSHNSHAVPIRIRLRSGSVHRFLGQSRVGADRSRFPLPSGPHQEWLKLQESRYLVQHLEALNLDLAPGTLPKRHQAPPQFPAPIQTNQPGSKPIKPDQTPLPDREASPQTRWTAGEGNQSKSKTAFWRRPRTSTAAGWLI